jgi:hypothetical protein
VSTAEPTITSLHAAVTAFGADGSPDKSWLTFTAATIPDVDFSLAAHRKAAHIWLNAWGCRIRYPRAGEPDVFDAGLAGWWSDWCGAVPPASVAMVDLSDDQLAGLGDCFAALTAITAAQTRSVRSLGPTAAAKLLFALRPRTLMPWDEMIAQRLHGTRDSLAYVAHQRLGRTWGRALLAEAGIGEDELCERLGRPGRSLAKVIDEYCYTTYTRGGAK